VIGALARAGLAALVVGVPVLLTRRGVANMVQAGDELLVPPNAVMFGPGVQLPAGLPTGIAFVVVKAQGPADESGVVSGSITSAQFVPVVSPPVGPVSVRRADVTTIVRQGQVVWEKK
jgi:hypothetical protein